MDLTALNLTVGDTAFDIGDFDGSPTAVFSGGVFLGLTFSLTTVPNGTPFDELAAEGDGRVTVTIDATDQVKPIDFGVNPDVFFTLPNNQTGTIVFDIPWGDIDPEEATQSLPVSNFALTLAGVTLTDQNVTFNTSPTADFEYGEFVGKTFDADTSGLEGYDYSDVSMTGLELSATDAGTATEHDANAVVANSAIVLDFSTVATGQSYRIHLDVYDRNNVAIETTTSRFRRICLQVTSARSSARP